MFTKHHESRRKDIERTIGVLQGRFKIIRSGNRIEFQKFRDTELIIRFCIFLHNIIVKMHGAYSLALERDSTGRFLSHNEIVCEFTYDLRDGWQATDYTRAQQRGFDVAERNRLHCALIRYSKYCTMFGIEA